MRMHFPCISAKWGNRSDNIAWVWMSRVHYSYLPDLWDKWRFSSLFQ